jgi:glycerol-3-phosphate dehydrogenase
MRIAVIGAGVIGTLIARELTRYEVDVLLFEKEDDIGWGVTKANSGIVHGGFHEIPDSERAILCVEGNRLFTALCEELDVPFARVGAWTIALRDEDRPALAALLEQGRANQVPGLELVDGSALRHCEPNVSPQAVAGLWAPSVGITEPWALAIAAVENACENGLRFHRSEPATGIPVRDGAVSAVVTPRAHYPVDVVVNAGGLFADRIAAMVGLDEPVQFPRRGEYVLLDKAAGSLIHSVIFPTPSDSSKGILVVPTVDGGVLLGPTAEDLGAEAKAETQTTAAGIRDVLDGAKRLIPSLDPSLAIKTFAGLRPETADEAFVIGATPVTGFYQAGGMRSPGLTAAPAVAARLVHAQMAVDLHLRPREGFRPVREGIPRLLDLPEARRDDLIAADPAYGLLVCHCNRVTEAEIVEAIRRGARSLDGVKFRTRAGFGRCQGGFCTDKVLALLARELRVPLRAVPLRGNETWLLGEEVRP